MGQSPPTRPSGFIAQTNPSHSAGCRRCPPCHPLSNRLGLGQQDQAPSVTREKGRAATPPPLFFQQNDRLLLDTRLADGISKGFREPSGVGTIIANHASNKARRVTSWQERSKTNSIMFLRDSILKKKKSPG